MKDDIYGLLGYLILALFGVGAVVCAFFLIRMLTG